MTDRALGLDVSRWQPKIDWPAVAAAGVKFVFIKASQHMNYKDPNFDANWTAAKEAGILRGAYHFYEPGVNAQAQAEYFVKCVGDDLGELPLVFDLEKAGALTNADLVKNSLIFLTTLKQITQRKPLIYTSRTFWHERMWPKLNQYPEWSKEYDYWVAHYTTRPEPAIHPSWGGWRIWQYTETGRIDGIPGNVDLNWFNGTLDDLHAWREAYLAVSFSVGAELPADFGDPANQPDDYANATPVEDAPPARSAFAGDE